MSLDPHQAQLLAQEARMEKAEDRICTVEQAVQTLIMRPAGEPWYVRHCGWLVAVVFAGACGFMACGAIR